MTEITDIYQLINSDKSRIGIENTLFTIDELSSKFGDLYIVSYSKKPKYIGVHREKCEGYKSWLEGNTLKFKKCNCLVIGGQYTWIFQVDQVTA